MYRITTPLLIGSLVLCSGYANAQVIIDSFQTVQSGTSTLDTADAIGGERDVEQVGEQNTATVGGGTASCSGSSAFNGCVFEYDGNDNDATNEGAGFSAVDLTAGGEDSIDIPTTADVTFCSLQVRVCSGATCDTTTATMPMGSSVRSDLFTAFSGVDFTQVTKVRFIISPQQANPFNCSLGAAATPVDLESFTVD